MQSSFRVRHTVHCVQPERRICLCVGSMYISCLPRYGRTHLGEAGRLSSPGDMRGLTPSPGLRGQSHSAGKASGTKEALLTHRQNVGVQEEPPTVQIRPRVLRQRSRANSAVQRGSHPGGMGTLWDLGVASLDQQRGLVTSRRLI